VRVLIDRGIPAAFWRKLLTGPVLPGNERFSWLAVGFGSHDSSSTVDDGFDGSSTQNRGGDQTARVISISSALYLAGASDTRGGEGVPIHRANFLRSSTLAART